jgi:hypothetical protein
MKTYNAVFMPGVRSALVGAMVDMSTCEEEIEEVVGCSIESIEESEYISSCYIISDKTRYSWVGIDADMISGKDTNLFPRVMSWVRNP